jgi:hypothetical protein
MSDMLGDNDGRSYVRRQLIALARAFPSLRSCFPRKDAASQSCEWFPPELSDGQCDLQHPEAKMQSSPLQLEQDSGVVGLEKTDVQANVSKLHVSFAPVPVIFENDLQMELKRFKNPNYNMKVRYIGMFCIGRHASTDDL